MNLILALLLDYCPIYAGKLRVQGSLFFFFSFFPNVITSRYFRMVPEVAKTSTVNPKDLILFSATKSGGG